MREPDATERIPVPLGDEPPASSSALTTARDLVEPAIRAFLQDRRAELLGMDPKAAVLVDEVGRLLAAGGKRIRPALCYWAHRAAGGRDPAIVRAAGALELLHTFALIHDDVMDGSDERRGAPATHVWFAKEAPPGSDPLAYGISVAILVGDLAAVLAEQMLRTCGASPGTLSVALARFDRMRAEMAAGQYLDLAGAARSSPAPPRVAALKTGSYTAEGPVAIGTAMAAAGPAVEGPLRTYARLLGEAFQLRDDVLDGQAGSAEAARVNELVDRAVGGLAAAPLEPRGVGALDELARLLRIGRA